MKKEVLNLDEKMISYSRCFGKRLSENHTILYYHTSISFIHNYVSNEKSKSRFYNLYQYHK